MREIQTKLALIGRFVIGIRLAVMHDQFDCRSRRYTARGVVRELQWRFVGLPRTEQVRANGVYVARGFVRRRFDQVCRALHDGGVARYEIEGVDPAVFGKVRRQRITTDFFSLIDFSRSVRLQQRIGFAQCPCLFGFRIIVDVAAWRAAFYPRDDQFEVALRQQVIVLEQSVAFHRLIGRHTAFEHFFLDGFGPRTRFFISGQRNVASDLTGRVAAPTTALQDARDFFVKRDFGRDRIVRA